MMTPMPAASPSANPGDEAHAAMQIRQALQLLQEALPKISLESPLHAAVTNSVKSLAKHVAGGGAGAAALDQSALRDLALRAQQQNPMVAAMAARKAAGAGATPTPTPGA